jgi:hypothetical protein
MSRFWCAPLPQDARKSKPYAMVEASISNSTPVNMTVCDVKFDAEVGFVTRPSASSPVAGAGAAVEDDGAGDGDLLDVDARQERFRFLRQQDTCSHVFFVDLATDTEGVVRVVGTICCVSP